MASHSWRWFVKHRAGIGMRVLFYAQFLLTCYQCVLGPSWRWFVKHRASIGMRVLFYAQFLLTCYQCLIGLLEFHHYYGARRALEEGLPFLDPLLEGGPFFFLIILFAAVLFRLHPKQALQYVGVSAILVITDMLGYALMIRR
jgi:hypothetical protein